MLVDKWRSIIGMIAVGACIAIVLASTAPMAGAEGFQFKAEFGPDGTTGSEFGAAGSVAVDEGAEAVYVLDRSANALFKFDVDGKPLSFGASSPNISGNELSGLMIGGGPGERQVAVDQATHTIYLTGAEEFGSATAIQAFEANGEPSIFPATGTNELVEPPGVRGVAVDSIGNIYAAGSEPSNPPTNANIKIYSRAGSVVVPSVQKGLLGMGNIAVDTTGIIYAVSPLEYLVRLVPSEFPVTGGTTYTKEALLGPVAVSGVTVDLLTNKVYVTENAQKAPQGVTRVSVLSRDGQLEKVFGGPGEEGELDNPDGVAVVNVQRPGIVEKVAEPFVSNNPSGGPKQVRIFEEELCICEPTVEASYVAAVTADSANLKAKINPNNLATEYWFEFGLQDCDFEDTCESVPIAPESVGLGRQGVSMLQSIAGLSAGSAYKFRVVARNDEGTVAGPEGFFRTQSRGLGFSLSDARVWEIVSPVDKFNGRVVADPRAIVQAKEDGDGLVYGSLGSLVAEPDSNHPPQIANVLSGRSGGGTWTSRDLSAPHTEAGLISSEFKIFSPDLRRGAMEPSDGTPLSPNASEKTSYLWDDGTPPLFTPLVNPSNVPPGTEFGPVPGAPDPVRIEGASPDLEHIVILSHAPLVENAPENALYLWERGDLKVVSQLPEAEGAGIVGGGMLGSGRGSVRHAISDDGARIFWSGPGAYNEGGNSLPSLYVRDMAADESGRIDIPRGGTGEGAQNPAFTASSSEGDVVFFTDSQHLTADASPEGRDLYRCEIGQIEGGGLGCAELTDVSAPRITPSESAKVLDQAPAATDDGTRLYFVAEGVLDEAPNEGSETASPEKPNLYYWHEGEGPRFVATLSDGDSRVWGQRKPPGFSVNISAAASPSGRFFAFSSERGLAGSDTHNEGGQPTTEAYLYDADEGTLACVSCNPTGAAPVGELLSEGVFFPPDPLGLWAGRWVAATLPQASENESSGRSFYHPRTVLDNGRVFFNSVDALVPADSNGSWDVYQYQPVGVGSCASGTRSPAEVRSASGCVSLVSSGISEGDAGFLDTTPSGNDAFFLTKGRLSVLDQDDDVDVYDARVNGIKAVLRPIQECAGEACQAASGPPSDPTPASESFRGPEATLRCRKGQHKVHRKSKTVCVRKKHNKQGKHHKRRAGANGRAGR
jgi:hypothetical protein